MQLTLNLRILLCLAIHEPSFQIFGPSFRTCRQRSRFFICFCDLLIVLQNRSLALPFSSSPRLFLPRSDFDFHFVISVDLFEIFHFEQRFENEKKNHQVFQASKPFQAEYKNTQSKRQQAHHKTSFQLPESQHCKRLCVLLIKLIKSASMYCCSFRSKMSKKLWWAANKRALVSSM